MIPFEKYQGCGNDVIIINASYVTCASKLVVEICNRYKGVGADGVILFQKHPLTMQYFNADGSEATMCGNGIRCFAKYCFDHQLWKQQNLAIQTRSGIRDITLINKDPFIVQVDMGIPSFNTELMHMQQPPSIPFSLTMQDKDVTLYPIYTTTMHVVIFVSSLTEEDLHLLGKTISHHEMFYHQTNVTFAHILNKSCIEIKTYERGIGFTQGCGSGACAGAYIAHKYKQCDTSIQVLMEGGSVDIHLEDTIYMSGHAQRIMEGIYYEQS